MMLEAGGKIHLKSRMSHPQNTPYLLALCEFTQRCIS